MNNSVKIDLKDKKILRELDMNARIPINKLAKKTGLSRQVALYRIKRLKKEGVISNFLTVFDSAVVGMRWFRVLIRMGKSEEAQRYQFLEYMKNDPNVVWLGEVGGNWDFVINFVSPDQFEFDRMFERILNNFGKFIQKYEILVYISVKDQERNYMLDEYDVNKKSLFHEMRVNRNFTPDEIDKKIIERISKNAELSNSEIAGEIGMNYKTVQNRIKEMEKNKIILGYRAMINPEKLGYESYMIFMAIGNYNAEAEQKLHQFFNHANVTFVVKQLGTWSIGLEIEVPDRDKFQKFLIELRTKFGDIISNYEIFPIFKDHQINYFPRGALNR
ncbi:MAG: Lrp/AsnC family transcriptional regulator [Candidatus Paceibacterota bacterium]|jgi:Lrp/AsnC family leucine-responsive transcriptional regulator